MLLKTAVEAKANMSAGYAKARNQLPPEGFKLQLLDAFLDNPADTRDKKPDDAMLNGLLETYETYERICSDEFPRESNDPPRPAPEDFVLQGLIFDDHYFPSDWFANDKVDDDEKYFEMASMTDVRKERILWLGYKIAQSGSRDADQLHPITTEKSWFSSEFDYIYVVDNSNYDLMINRVALGTNNGNKGGQSKLVGNPLPRAGMQVGDTIQTMENQWRVYLDAFQITMAKATQQLGMFQTMGALSGSNCRRKKRHWRQPLVFAAAVSTLVLPTAAAMAGPWGPHLRIGAGFAGFSLGVVPIPLRRDARIDPLSLIPVYVLSLICTALFIALQYANITRNRGQYLFGTFVLTAHLIGGLSQTSDTTLDGIIDLGPVLLPAVAALVSLLFPRHQQPTWFRYPRRVPPRHETTNEDDVQRPEEDDIGLQPLAELGQAAAGLVPATS